MWHKKLVITIALMALFVAACNQSTPAPINPTTTPEPTLTPIPQEDSWQKVQGAGVLRVGTSADYPPFESYDENHNFVGFDIALIQQLGQKLGLKVEINDFAFDGLPMAVASSQIDVVISAFSVTPERQSIANFSNVY